MPLLALRALVLRATGFVYLVLVLETVVLLGVLVTSLLVTAVPWLSLTALRLLRVVVVLRVTDVALLFPRFVVVAFLLAALDLVATLLFRVALVVLLEATVLLLRSPSARLATLSFRVTLLRVARLLVLLVAFSRTATRLSFL